MPSHGAKTGAIPVRATRDLIDKKIIKKEAEKTKIHIPESVRDVFRSFGKKGGKATVKKHGKKYMRTLGKKAAEKRWLKNKKSPADSTP